GGECDSGRGEYHASAYRGASPQGDLCGLWRPVAGKVGACERRLAYRARCARGGRVWRRLRCAEPCASFTESAALDAAERAGVVVPIVPGARALASATTGAGVFAS